MCFILFCSPRVHASQLIEAAFSPSPEAIKLVQHTIDDAKQSIALAGYSFSSYKVADALIDAKKRGIDVMVVLDNGQRNRHYPAIKVMQDAGIPIRFNRHYAIMHNKYIIVDGKTIETGSFNYTTSAEKRNAENVIVIKDDKELAEKYSENWKKLWNEGDAPEVAKR